MRNGEDKKGNSVHEAGFGAAEPESPSVRASGSEVLTRGASDNEYDGGKGNLTEESDEGGEGRLDEVPDVVEGEWMGSSGKGGGGAPTGPSNGSNFRVDLSGEGTLETLGEVRKLKVTLQAKPRAAEAVEEREEVEEAEGRGGRRRRGTRGGGWG